MDYNAVNDWCRKNNYMILKRYDHEDRNLAIADLCKAGNLTQRQIGELFDLNVGTVKKIYALYRSPNYLSPRRREAINLRLQGFTYGKIAEILGISIGKSVRAVGKIPEDIKKAYDEKKAYNKSNQDPFMELSNRVSNILKSLDLFSMPAVLEAVQSGKLSTKEPYYGKKAHKEVCDWLGIDTKTHKPLK